MVVTVVRLKRRRDFLRAARKGRKAVEKGVVMQVLTRENTLIDDEKDDCVRLGFTVSKKVGNAVQRNRAKRRLRAAAEIVIPSQSCAGLDIVLIGRVHTLVRPFSALVTDVSRALKKAGGLDHRFKPDFDGG